MELETELSGEEHLLLLQKLSSVTSTHRRALNCMQFFSHEILHPPYYGLLGPKQGKCACRYSHPHKYLQKKKVIQKAILARKLLKVLAETLF